jgi:hypothetical protein
MSWEVKTSAEFDKWYAGLKPGRQDEIDQLVNVLKAEGRTSSDHSSAK